MTLGGLLEWLKTKHEMRFVKIPRKNYHAGAHDAYDHLLKVLPHDILDMNVEYFEKINPEDDGSKCVAPKNEQDNQAYWVIRKFGDHAWCSRCGFTQKDVYDLENHQSFCGHCGADMRGLILEKEWKEIASKNKS